VLPKKLDPFGMHVQGTPGVLQEIHCKGQQPRRMRDILDYARFEMKKISLTSGVIGLLTGPHQTSFSDDSSLTIRLSEGERPVLAPEYAVNAPLDVMAVPVS
jgi:hypothetical protein